MQIEPWHSHQLPAEWTGGRWLIESWLSRRCLVDSLLQLVGALLLVLVGLVALALTSGIIAAVLFTISIEAGAILSGFGVPIGLGSKWLFSVLLLVVMGLSVFYAWSTRRETISAGSFRFDRSVPGLAQLALEFTSAGPIFFVLAVQDARKSMRLMRVDVPQVSAILLWLYDQNSRAGFAEISMALPGLNVIRVLPQLRDFPGVYWWPQEGEITLSDELRDTLKGVVGREPRNFAFPGRPPPPGRGPRFEAPATPVIGDEMLAWYRTLNLPPFATLQQVKARYRKLAKIYHPDTRARNPGTTAAADDGEMKRINEAYHNIIKRAESRPGAFD